MYRRYHCYRISFTWWSINIFIIPQKIYYPHPFLQTTCDYVNGSCYRSTTILFPAGDYIILYIWKRKWHKKLIYTPPNLNLLIVFLRKRVTLCFLSIIGNELMISKAFQPHGLYAICHFRYRVSSSSNYHSILCIIFFDVS